MSGQVVVDLDPLFLLYLLVLVYIIQIYVYTNITIEIINKDGRVAKLTRWDTEGNNPVDMGGGLSLRYQLLTWTQKDLPKQKFFI